MNCLLYLLAVYFGILFHIRMYCIGNLEVDSTSIFFILLSLFFFLIPSAHKISIGKILSFEAKAEKIKEDVKEFKHETRETLQVFNNLINAVSNTVNQSVNVYFPNDRDVEAAEQSIENAKDVSNTETNKDEIEDKLKEYLASFDFNISYALGALRIDLESLLRKILEKRTRIDSVNSMTKKFYSIRSLFSLLVKSYPEYENLYPAMDYVIKSCNAAIHGQNIPVDQGKEALSIGLELKNILEQKYNKN